MEAKKNSKCRTCTLVCRKLSALAIGVSFGEDMGRKTGNAAQNFSLMNKIALMLLKKSPRKGSIKGKRKAAGWDTEFLCELLLAQNF